MLWGWSDEQGSKNWHGKVGPWQAQREKGSSPTLDVNRCCCSFVWVGQCIASQVLNWPRPTLLLSIRSNHLTAIFGQCVPYPASIQIIISGQRMVLIEKVFISEFIMAIHDFQNISKSIPGGRPGGTAPIAETGAVPAP